MKAVINPVQIAQNLTIEHIDKMSNCKDYEFSVQYGVVDIFLTESKSKDVFSFCAYTSPQICYGIIRGEQLLSFVTICKHLKEQALMVEFLNGDIEIERIKL